MSSLGWPAPGDASADSGLGCNRLYIDLRRLTWTEAKRVLALERQLIRKVESHANPIELEEFVAEELSAIGDSLYGLDVGVAAAVVALSAARCIPFNSCNGGAFGGHHQEVYPLVAFYTRNRSVDLIISAAEEANIGLYGQQFLVAYADDVRKLMDFSERLIKRSGSFRLLRDPRPVRLQRRILSDQLELPRT